MPEKKASLTDEQAGQIPRVKRVVILAVSGMDWAARNNFSMLPLEETLEEEKDPRVAGMESMAGSVRFMSQSGHYEPWQVRWDPFTSLEDALMLTDAMAKRKIYLSLYLADHGASWMAEFKEENSVVEPTRYHDKNMAFAISMAAFKFLHAEWQEQVAARSIMA